MRTRLIFQLLVWTAYACAASPQSQRDGGTGIVGKAGGASTQEAGTAAKQSEPRTPWRARAPLPTPRAGLRAVALGGKIYVLGGVPGKPSLTAPQLDLVEIYEPAANSWTGHAAMPILRGTGGAAVVGAKVYVIDGADGAVHEFDPKTMRWTAKSARMPTVRTIFATAVANGKIYTMGGLARDPERGYRNSNAVEAYDPATDTWAAVAKMRVPRHALAAVTWKDTIFTIGGDADAPAGGPNIRTNIVEAYDLASNTWRRRASSPLALHYHPAALAQGRIYAFDGDVAAVISYDPQRDAWTRVASKPHVRWAEAAAEANGRIYLFGGWDNPNFDAVLEYNEEYDPAADPSAR